MEQLKPCPFCGVRAFFGHNIPPKNGMDTFYVYCGNEDCCVNPRTHPYFKKDQAKSAWNGRANID